MTYVIITTDPTGRRPITEDRTEQPDDIIAALDRNAVTHSHTSLSLAKHLQVVGPLRVETAYAKYYIFIEHSEKTTTAKRLKLEVGKTYTNASGARVEITHWYEATGTFLSACGNGFRHDGRFASSLVPTIHDIIHQCPDTEPAMMNVQTQAVIAKFETDPDFLGDLEASNRRSDTIERLARDVISRRGGTTTWGHDYKNSDYKAIDRDAFAAHFVKLYAIDKPKIDGNTDRGIQLVVGVKYTLRNGTIIEMDSGPHPSRDPNSKAAYFTSRYGTYEKNGLYQRSDYTRDEEYDIVAIAPSTSTSTPTTTKEKAPMNLALSTITYLNGDDVSKLTDDELISRIRSGESELANMDKIVNKPKKLQARMDKLTADIKILVEYIDSREAK